MAVPDYERLRRQREEFHALYDVDADARAARLAALEREDPPLAESVRDMLRRADAERDEEPSAAPGVGSVLGRRYRLLREISTGGMGEVYLAERTDDVRKQVALKLVRADLPHAREHARREQDILARLVHPNIAGLLDAGVSAQGWPWFAMDYIDGEHVDAWCDHRRLDLAARTRLFARVCRAVHFAHKNLVLHRDLKPSNILIDSGGEPKLLDFGIAKWLDADDAAAGTTRTLALTPAYASPEQLRGEAATTASDVYQLGLVLYELVGGIGARKARTNADAPTRVDRAFGSLIQRDPTEAERVAAARGERARRLRRILRGDLARIVAKATADDAQERYDSAQALADDLERWSRGLPVAAHRGSFAYRASKLIRRNAAATVAIALLALGLVATSIVAVNRAERERAQRVLVEQQQRRSASLLEFMRDAFREGDPNRTRGEKLGAVELLDRAREKLDRRSDLDEPARAALQAQVAEVLLELGRADLALPSAHAATTVFEPIREEHPADYLESVSTLAQAQQALGRYREALDVVDSALPLTRRTVGEERRWLPRLLTQRGMLLTRLGRLDDAQADMDAALAEFRETGDLDSKDYLAASNDLASLANNRGDYRTAADLYRRILQNPRSREVFPATDLMALQSNLAVSHYFLGEAKTAIAILEPLVSQYDALGLSAHNRTAYVRIVLASSLLADGDYARARSVLASVPAAPEAVATWEPLVQWRLHLVRAKLALYTGRFGDALTVLRVDAERVLPSAQRSPSQRINTQTLIEEARLQRDGGADAIAPLQQALLEARAASEGMRQGRTQAQATLEDSLGRAYLDAGDFIRAREHLNAAAELLRAMQGPAMPFTLRSEIHCLWAEALETRDPAVVDRLIAKRAELASALGGEAKPQVWQADLLIDDLAHALGRPGLDAAVRARAEAGLAQLDGGPAKPRFVGLNGF